MDYLDALHHIVIVVAIGLVALIAIVIVSFQYYHDQEIKRLQKLCTDQDFFNKNGNKCMEAQQEIAQQNADAQLQAQLNAGQCLTKAFYFSHYDACEARNQRPKEFS